MERAISIRCDDDDEDGDVTMLGSPEDKAVEKNMRMKMFKVESSVHYKWIL